MNSKKKGNRFERVVSKWFTEWTGFNFGRTPSSGAYHRNKDLASDVMCNDERHAHRCKISIECKSYKDIKFEHLLLGTKGCEIEKFWAQASKDAERAKRIPLLIMRYNSMPKDDFFMVIGENLAETFLVPEMLSQRYMAVNTPDLSLYIFMASSVKKYVSYKDVHKAAKLLLK